MIDNIIRDDAVVACSGHPPGESTAADDPEGKVESGAESWRAGDRPSKKAIVLTSRAEKARLARNGARARAGMLQAKGEQTEACLMCDLGVDPDLSDAVDHLIRDAAAAARAEPLPAESTLGDDPYYKCKRFACESWRAGGGAQLTSASASTTWALTSWHERGALPTLTARFE